MPSAPIARARVRVCSLSAPSGFPDSAHDTNDVAKSSLFVITCDPSGIACPFKAAVLRSSAESLLLWGMSSAGRPNRPPASSWGAAGRGAYVARLRKPRHGAWRRLEQPLGRAAARLDEIPPER